MRFINVGIGEGDSVDDLYNTADGGFCSDNICFVAQRGASSPKSECYGAVYRIVGGKLVEI